MNQAIHFPDREIWDENKQAVCFPVLVHGMQLTCAIKGETLLQRFGGGRSVSGLLRKSLGPGRGCQRFDPRSAGRRSGLDLVILIQIVIFPFNVIVR